MSLEIERTLDQSCVKWSKFLGRKDGLTVRNRTRLNSREKEHGARKGTAERTRKRQKEEAEKRNRKKARQEQKERVFSSFSLSRSTKKTK